MGAQPGRAVGGGSGGVEEQEARTSPTAVLTDHFALASPGSSSLAAPMPGGTDDAAEVSRASAPVQIVSSCYQLCSTLANGMHQSMVAYAASNVLQDMLCLFPHDRI